MKNKVLRTFLIFAIGQGLGFLAKILDIYTTNLGNIFSETSIWILFGVLISVYSRSPGRAAINMLFFCIGMLLTYYLTARLTGGVYSTTFIYGWCIFTLICPLFAAITWHARGQRIISIFIVTGILVVTMVASIVLFDGPRIYDFIIAAAILYICTFSRFTPAGNRSNGRRSSGKRVSDSHSRGNGNRTSDSRSNRGSGNRNNDSRSNRGSNGRRTHAQAPTKTTSSAPRKKRNGGAL